MADNDPEVMFTGRMGWGLGVWGLLAFGIGACLGLGDWRLGYIDYRVQGPCIRHGRLGIAEYLGCWDSKWVTGYRV